MEINQKTYKKVLKTYIKKLKKNYPNNINI
jgi:hypothetical protein